MDTHIIKEDEETINFYKKHYDYLNLAIDNVVQKIEKFRALEIQKGLGRDPIDNLKSRIKTAQSIKDKLRRYKLAITLENAIKSINDAAGVRILCTFLDDVYYVADFIQHSSGIKVHEIKDYVAKPKPNGYRSYHMIVAVDVNRKEKKKSIYVEIQIRTIAMDCWASLEHQLKYKKTICYEDMMIKELKRCADEIATVDLNLQTIRYIIDSSDSLGGKSYETISRRR
jgi:putative GTP pyrophosphokinase